MAEANLSKPALPGGNGIVAVFLGWVLPGAGHFVLRRPLRGVLILGATLIMFLVGLLMRGAFFQPLRGDALTTLIYCGGFATHVASGALYFLATALGYNQPDVAGHTVDYGTKFLVGAGLLNILAMVDAWEIATGKRS
ncbi:MAG TPA: DUF6677 family protein [Bryobacteraceae bacterium]|nr:DUF6677 family protein [Bryobacteraceae bacterium]